LLPNFEDKQHSIWRKFEDKLYYYIYTQILVKSPCCVFVCLSSPTKEVGGDIFDFAAQFRGQAALNLEKIRGQIVLYIHTNTRQKSPCCVFVCLSSPTKEVGDDIFVHQRSVYHICKTSLRIDIWYRGPCMGYLVLSKKSKIFTAIV
jgi:hypothetical protein